jgi:hypothetical protein
MMEMTAAPPARGEFGPTGPLGGVVLTADATIGPEAAARAFGRRLDALGLGANIREIRASDNAIRFHLDDQAAQVWTPGWDTLQLCERLSLDTLHKGDDLEREVLVAMLCGPVAFEFPSYEELTSAVRIRQNIVAAARKTALAFHTTEAERPLDYWTYVKGRGFVVLPGKSLLEALQRATQPDVSGKVYSFSCYRATEYVILLGVAQELAACNPTLFEHLQEHWRTRAIMSGQFHDVFLREYGSMAEPLPPMYYVPGDRLWFRNPDQHSSDITGYEGSWVFYLGGGLFTNFWKRDQPYTMTNKCVEIYHWRHATYRDESGDLQIDESVVEERVAESLSEPSEVARILAEMFRLREPKGVYGNGGCIDTSREYPRWVCPGTGDLVLPPS